MPGTSAFERTCSSSSKISSLSRSLISEKSHSRSGVVSYHVGKSLGSFVCAWRTFTISSRFLYLSAIALLIRKFKLPALAASFRDPNNGAASILSILAVDPVISRSCQSPLSKVDMNSSRCAFAATAHTGKISTSLRYHTANCWEGHSHGRRARRAFSRLKHSCTDFSEEASLLASSCTKSRTKARIWHSKWQNMCASSCNSGVSNASAYLLPTRTGLISLLGS
jgi:hypothetical protein